MVCLILREENEESSSKLGSKMAAKSNMAAKMADNTYPWILEQNPQKPLQTRDRNSIEEESILEEKNLQWKGLFLHSVPSVEFLAKRAMYF